MHTAYADVHRRARRVGAGEGCSSVPGGAASTPHVVPGDDDSSVAPTQGPRPRRHRTGCPSGSCRCRRRVRRAVTAPAGRGRPPRGARGGTGVAADRTAGTLHGVRAGRWADVPATERRLALAAAAVFGYGAVVHVAQLVLGGADPYPCVPGWLAGLLRLADPPGSHRGRAPAAASTGGPGARLRGSPHRCRRQRLRELRGRRGLRPDRRSRRAGGDHRAGRGGARGGSAPVALAASRGRAPTAID